MLEAMRGDPSTTRNRGATAASALRDAVLVDSTVVPVSSDSCLWTPSNTPGKRVASATRSSPASAASSPSS